MGDFIAGVNLIKEGADVPNYSKSASAEYKELVRLLLRLGIIVAMWLIQETQQSHELYSIQAALISIKNLNIGPE